MREAHFNPAKQTEKLNARLPCLSPLGQSAGSGFEPYMPGVPAFLAMLAGGVRFRDAPVWNAHECYLHILADDWKATIVP